jgi:murein DD-endopeptidase MepM/ murein hydrolase activator NlpD
LCSAGEALRLEAVCNASVREGAEVTFSVYREGDTPGRNEPVETLTGINRAGKAVAEWAYHRRRDVQNLLRTGRRFIIAVFTAGAEEVQSGVVEVDPVQEPVAELVFPTDSRRITWAFGNDHPLGVDIGALTPGVSGDPIFAAMGGVITMAEIPSWSPSSSTYIIINGDDGRTYRYLHILIPDTIQVGDIVTTGQQIATMSHIGSPGQVHLHFEVFENGQRIDPLSLFSDLTFTFP